MLGPPYHLTERADRVRALAEARRALYPGGVVAAAAISRYASTLDGLFRGLLREPGFDAVVERDVTDGQHPTPTTSPAGSPPRTSTYPTNCWPRPPTPDSTSWVWWPWRARRGCCPIWTVGLATTVSCCYRPSAESKPPPLSSA